MALQLDVHIGAQPVFSIGGFGVTNAMLTGVVGVVALVIIFAYVGIMIRLGKYNRFVGFVQWVFEGLLNQISSVIPDPVLARKITPLALTIFFAVVIDYWLSLLPGLDSVTWLGAPLLRSMDADLNFTLGLAIITMVTVQIYAIRYLGVLGNLKRYVRNPLKDPIGAFEGALEVVGELSRGLALAFRLFGNAFAGEVLLVVVAALTSYAATVVLPFFMFFELFIGFVQAYVFFILTLIFTSLAVGHKAEVETPAEALAAGVERMVQ